MFDESVASKSSIRPSDDTRGQNRSVVPSGARTTKSVAGAGGAKARGASHAKTAAAAATPSAETIQGRAPAADARVRAGTPAAAAAAITDDAGATEDTVPMPAVSAMP